jgi:transcriptional regulator with XRE-family HTH domain
MTATTFGRYFAELRRNRLALSLREFCARNEFDPGNVSKLERGRVAPPQSRIILERYAAALQLAEGSDEWYEFFDRAAAARGEIPSDLLDDDQIVAHLPALFRTIRGKRVTNAQLQKLVDIIRRA